MWCCEEDSEALAKCGATSRLQPLHSLQLDIQPLHYGPMLGQPRDDIVPEKHHIITWRGFASFGTTCSICIHVNSEISR